MLRCSLCSVFSLLSLCVNPLVYIHEQGVPGLPLTKCAQQSLGPAQVKPDAIAFNCVLDVCVKAGDLVRARKLVQEMKDTCLQLRRFCCVMQSRSLGVGMHVMAGAGTACNPAEDMISTIGATV